MTALTDAPARPVRLGLRENLAQFALLVAVNALGRRDDRPGTNVLPVLAEREFGLTAFTAGLIGVAASACVACCAGPRVAFLGGVSVAGLASTVLIGGLGFVIAGLAGVAFMTVRRHRRRCGPTSAASVKVDAPTRKTTEPATTY